MGVRTRDYLDYHRALFVFLLYVFAGVPVKRNNIYLLYCIRCDPRQLISTNSHSNLPVQIEMGTSGLPTYYFPIWKYGGIGAATGRSLLSSAPLCSSGDSLLQVWAHGTILRFWGPQSWWAPYHGTSISYSCKQQCVHQSIPLE